MSKRYSGKSFKDSSIKKKPKLNFKEKRKLKRESNSQLLLIKMTYLLLLQEKLEVKDQTNFKLMKLKDLNL